MNQHELDDQLDDLLAEWEIAQEEGREVSVEDLCGERSELVGPLRNRIKRLRKTAWMLVDPACPTVDEPADPGDTQQARAELTVPEFVASVAESGLLTEAQVAELESLVRDEPCSAGVLAAKLVKTGLLTKYQANVILNRGKDPLLLDRYIILDAIGSGGMGIVFKALHTSMERIVAIKVLPEFAVNSLDKIARFKREVKSAAKLSHPNVVTAFDAHERNGTYFLVMEYVDGEDMSERVDRQGPLSVDDALSMLDQVAAGLGAAHALGMVHRDVKPTNIMLTNDGTAKLLDLGLARMMMLSSQRSEPDLTKDGLSMGTASYMSPEQALDAKEADGRSDIYSLGCTFYFLLTGKPPFVCNTTVQTIVAHREVPPPSLTNARDDVRDAVEKLYRRMVAKSPADRFQNVSELRSAIQSLGTPSEISVPKVTPPTSVRNNQSIQRNWLATTLALVAILATTITGWVVWGGRSATGRQESPVLQRDIAKWALSSGGFVTIRNDLGEQDLETTSDLPEGDFKIIGLDLYADSDDFSIAPALKVESLQTLTLTEVVRIDVEDIAALKSLTDLAMYGCAITDSDLDLLASMTQLKALSLEDCDVTDDGIMHIAKLNQLKILELGGTRVTGQGIQRLSALPQLRSLNLRDLDFKPQDLQGLSPSIDNLGMSFCKLGDDIVKVLPRFTGLSRLDLQGNALTASGIEDLKSLPSLTTLDLSDMKIDVDGFAALKGFPSLEDLTLMGVKLNQQKFAALVEIPKLRTLDLSGTNLDDDGLLSLAAMNQLKELYLDGTKTSEAGVDRLQRSRSDLTIFDTSDYWY